MSVGKECQVASIPVVVATRGSINETLCCNSEHIALLTFPVIVKSESPAGSGATIPEIMRVPSSAKPQR